MCTWHSINMCLADCIPCLHGQSGELNPSTFLKCRNFLRPIFSVLICTIRALHWQNLGPGPKLHKLSRAPGAPCAWVSVHGTCELIDLRKVLYFPCNSSFAVGNMSAYGVFVLLCNIVNNISFNHYCNTVNNISFSHHCNTITKSTILSIAQALRVLFWITTSFSVSYILAN